MDKKQSPISTGAEVPEKISPGRKVLCRQNALTSQDSTSNAENAIPLEIPDVCNGKEVEHCPAGAKDTEKISPGRKVLCRQNALTSQDSTSSINSGGSDTNGGTTPSNANDDTLNGNTAPNAEPIPLVNPVNPVVEPGNDPQEGEGVANIIHSQAGTVKNINSPEDLSCPAQKRQKFSTQKDNPVDKSYPSSESGGDSGPSLTKKSSTDDASCGSVLGSEGSSEGNVVNDGSSIIMRKEEEKDNADAVKRKTP